MISKISKLKKGKVMSKKILVFEIDTCVCCGNFIPEGQMICVDCQRKLNDSDNNNREVIHYEKEKTKTLKNILLRLIKRFHLI